MNILVVDNEDDVLVSLKVTQQAKGYMVVTAPAFLLKPAELELLQQAISNTYNAIF